MSNRNFTNDKSYTNVVLPKEAWKEIDLSFLEKGEEIEPIDYVDIFGEKLAEYISHAARASSCSREYIMLPLITITSVIIGNKRKVKVWETWEEPTHLWGALVGNPSCRKSAAMIPFYKALKPLNDRRMEKYKHLRGIYLDSVKNIKANKENSAIHNELISALNKPILNQIILNDTTTEALCDAIDPNDPRCICLFRDELVGFMKNLEKYNKNDKTLFLEGYNGNPYTINRKSKDEPVQIPELSISLLGGIQPEKFIPIIKSADDGFISRFLFVYSDPIKIDLGYKHNFDIGLLQQILDRLDTELKDNESLSLSDEAREILQGWIDKHHEDQECVSGLFASSYGKMHGQIIRLACVLEHLLWAAVQNNIEPPTTITSITILKAIDLMEFYFKPMAAKIFSECSNYRSRIPLLDKFVRHIAEAKENSFNWRALIDRGVFKRLKDQKDAIIDLLTKHNLIRRIICASSGRGRPKEEYRINPGLKSAFTEFLNEDGSIILEDAQV